MSQTITSGALSYQNNSFQESQTSSLFQLDSLLKDLPTTYEVIDICPDQQEILLKIQDPISFNSEEVRNLLQTLQNKFQRSFVALVNIRSQSILIAVRR